MIQARLLENDDYPTLVKWWEANRFPPIGFDYLPQVNGELQGIMVYTQTDLICAGFIIDTTIKKGAMLEYIVANFDIKDRDLRKKAINLLIDTMCATCKAMGKTFVFTSLKNYGLQARFKDCNFVVGSNNTCEMVKNIA